MAVHSHLRDASRDPGTRLMAMSAGGRMFWAALLSLVLWLAVWWALSFQAVAPEVLR